MERFHQTLKNIMKTFCLDSHKDWDDGVNILLVSTREAFHESLRIIPFELFGHSVGSTFRKKMALCFMYKLTRACEIEQDHLKQNQDKMKQWYDTDALIRKFKSAEKVIVLLFIHCHPL
jgi:hypothetical protein